MGKQKAVLALTLAPEYFASSVSTNSYHKLSRITQKGQTLILNTFVIATLKRLLQSATYSSTPVLLFPLGCPFILSAPTQVRPVQRIQTYPMTANRLAEHSACPLG